MLTLTVIGFPALGAILLAEALLQWKYLGIAHKAGLAACVFFIYLFQVVYSLIVARPLHLLRKFSLPISEQRGPVSQYLRTSWVPSPTPRRLLRRFGTCKSCFSKFVPLQKQRSLT